LVALALTLALAAAACGSSGSQTKTAGKTTAAATYTANFSTDEGTPRDGGVLAFGLEAESDSLSPVTGRWALSGQMEGSAIFDPLSTMDANGKVVPYLAKSFAHSPDYKTWTITMRPGIEFQDGEKCDANAIALNLNTYRQALITGKAFKPVTSVQAT